MLPIKSVIPNVDFLGLPDARGCQLLALQFQLERSQWLAVDEVESTQFRLAWNLYHHAVENVEFYKRRDHGIDAQILDAHSANNWLKLPMLRRVDLQDSFEELQCHPEGHGRLSTISTSGSSGSPVITVGTAWTRILWHALTFRHHLWHGWDMTGKLATIRTIDGLNGDNKSGHQQNGWGLSTNDVLKTGPSVGMDIHVGIDKQVEWLVREAPDYLLTYPSVAIALIECLRQERQELPSLREIRTFGELLDPRLRPLCQEVLGIPVRDSYSSQEVGYIAIQCPDSEEYHVQAESVLVEVIDDDGRPCEPGEVGRVIITTLQNFAMPLIRYEIGDYAEVGKPCSCGRGMPVLRKIVGRQRNMAILPDGREIWPCTTDTLLQPEFLEHLPPVSQFQVVQIQPDEVDVFIVADRELTEDEEPLISGLIYEAFDWPMQVNIIYTDEIKRGAGGKFEDYRCDVPAAVRNSLKRKKNAEADS